MNFEWENDVLDIAIVCLWYWDHLRLGAQRVSASSCTFYLLQICAALLFCTFYFAGINIMCKTLTRWPLMVCSFASCCCTVQMRRGPRAKKTKGYGWVLLCLLATVESRVVWSRYGRVLSLGTCVDIFVDGTCNHICEI